MELLEVKVDTECEVRTGMHLTHVDINSLCPRTGCPSPLISLNAYATCTLTFTVLFNRNCRSTSVIGRRVHILVRALQVLEPQVRCGVFTVVVVGADDVVDVDGGGPGRGRGFAVEDGHALGVGVGLREVVRRGDAEGGCRVTTMMIMWLESWKET